MCNLNDNYENANDSFRNPQIFNKMLKYAVAFRVTQFQEILFYTKIIKKNIFLNLFITKGIVFYLITCLF